VEGAAHDHTLEDFTTIGIQMDLSADDDDTDAAGAGSGSGAGSGAAAASTTATPPTAAAAAAAATEPEEDVVRRKKHRRRRRRLFETVELVVGSAYGPTSVAAPSANLVCPSEVNKENWSTEGDFGDVFAVVVADGQVSVSPPFPLTTLLSRRPSLSPPCSLAALPSHHSLSFVSTPQVSVTRTDGICTRILGGCGWGFELKFNCLDMSAQIENYYRKVEGVGAAGGVCTCPDGATYEVGDNGDSCDSLACEGEWAINRLNRLVRRR
jgi:hypothetical protein